MKKTYNILSKLILLLIIVMCATLIFSSVKWRKDNCVHTDLNADMICDSCKVSLPGNESEEKEEQKTLEATSENNTLMNISGNMPSNTKANISDVKKEDAISIAKQYMDVKDEDIVNAYDISLKANDKKYQPAEHNEVVEVELENAAI